MEATIYGLGVREWKRVWKLLRWVKWRRRTWNMRWKLGLCKGSIGIHVGMQEKLEATIIENQIEKNMNMKWKLGSCIRQGGEIYPNP